MKIILPLILLIITVIPCNSQDRKIEKIYNDCYFRSMPDNGKQVKEYYKTYEKLLISEGYLEDNSGESYYKLFEKVVTDQLMDTVTNYTLIDTINKLDYSDLVHFNYKCTDKIKSLKNYNNSNTYLLEKRTDSIKGDFNPDKVYKIFLETLNHKDFEFDYYKLRTLLILEMNESFSELEIEEPQYTEERIENSLVIDLSKENYISIDNKALNDVEFKSRVKHYILENMENSLITIDSSRDVQYSKYKKFTDLLQLAFSELKNEISSKRFNKKYENLTKDEKTAMEKEYSFDVNENTLE